MVVIFSYMARFYGINFYGVICYLDIIRLNQNMFTDDYGFN